MKYLSHPDEINQASFKAHKNCLTKSSKSAKQLYYLKAFNNAHGSPKRMWSLINDCIDEMMTPNGITAVKRKINVEKSLNLAQNSADFKRFLPTSTHRSIFLTQCHLLNWQWYLISSKMDNQMELTDLLRIYLNRLCLV